MALFRGGRRFKNGSVLLVNLNRSKAAFALVRSVTVVTESRAPWPRGPVAPCALTLRTLLTNNNRQEVAREPQRGEVAVQYDTIQ